MSFVISLVVILLFIALAVFIQYLVRSKSKTIPTALLSVAMITSDWNLEPSSTNATIKCGGNTPIGLIKSALEDFSKDIIKEQRLFFYTGDKTSPTKTVMSKMFDKDQGLLKYFDPANIFFAVGGEFWQKEKVSELWTQSLVDNGIYTPVGVTDIFWQCGYYKKHLPNSTIDIICFNSIMYSIVDGHKGCDNCECQDKQITQLKKDLDNLSPNRTVYILTHYPIDSDGVAYNRFIWDKIGVKYQNIVSGIFTSYTRTPLASLNQWKSKAGISNTWNIPSIFVDDTSSYIRVEFPLNTPLVLSQTDAKKVNCSEIKTSRVKWV